MKISDNVYQQLMSQAADKMTELYDKVKLQDEELATLRAQLAEAREANERLVWRLNWIRINPSDSVATRYALKATDEEIDDIRSKE